jgi:hypothetical protein
VQVDLDLRRGSVATGTVAKKDWCKIELIIQRNSTGSRSVSFQAPRKIDVILST